MSRTLLVCLFLGCPLLLWAAPAPLARRPAPEPAVTAGELCCRDWACSWNGVRYRLRLTSGGAYSLFSDYLDSDVAKPAWVGTWRYEKGVLSVSERSHPDGGCTFRYRVPLSRTENGLGGTGTIDEAHGQPSKGELRFTMDRR